jgi:hypothetical protein
MGITFRQKLRADFAASRLKRRDILLDWSNTPRSENTFYLQFDMPQSRTCWTGGLTWFKINLIWFIIRRVPEAGDSARTEYVFRKRTSSRYETSHRAMASICQSPKTNGLNKQFRIFFLFDGAKHSSFIKLLLAVSSARRLLTSRLYIRDIYIIKLSEWELAKPTNLPEANREHRNPKCTIYINRNLDDTTVNFSIGKIY